MVTLHDLLSLIGYTSETEQIAYVRLMAYRGCFSKPRIDAEEKYDDAVSYKHKQFVVNALPIWEKTGLKEYYLQKIIITEDNANKFLQTPFPSLEQGFTWLFNISELLFLRISFFEEGIGPTNEEKSVNLNRWKVKPELSECKILNQSIQALNLTDETPWPVSQEAQYVVLFSNLEHVVKERIAFIPEFKGTLYCLTGPRGLFKFEESLAAILSEWFNNKDYEKLIQQVLDKENNQYEWTSDLTGLKKIILKAVNETKWPAAKQSYYYQDKIRYDQAAIEAKREPLDCLEGPWPVAVDLIMHHLKKQKYNLEGITIKPVIALSTNGRLVGVSEEITAWFHQYGKAILDVGQTPIFVASNLIHATPFIEQTIRYDIGCKETRLKRKFFEKANQFQLEEKISGVGHNKILVVGPGKKISNLRDVYDSLAKILFAIKSSNINELITEFESKRYKDDQLAYAKKMIGYHNCKSYLSLANASFDLANFFLHKNDVIKAIGLLHFSINVLRFVDNKDYEKLEVALHDCTLIGMKIFVDKSIQKLALPEKKLSITTLRENAENNKKILQEIRHKLEKQFLKAKLNGLDSIRDLYETCFQDLKKFLILLIQQSMAIYGELKVDLSFVYLGSYGRKQQTPYSDLEWCILTDGKDFSFKFSLELTKLILIEVLNLGETVLPSLGIQFLIGKIYDFYTKQGYSFDRGFITPLGMKDCFRLVATPENMVSQMSSWDGLDKNIFLPQVMRLSNFICGNEFLYNYFCNLLIRDDFPVCPYARMLLEKDMTYLTPLLNSKNINHKNGYYRAVVVFVENLHLPFSPSCVDAFEKIDRLYEHGVLSSMQQTVLKQNLLWVLFLRFYQLNKFKEQKTEFKLDDKFYPVVVNIQNSMKELFVSFKDKLAANDNATFVREISLAKSSSSFFGNTVSPEDKSIQVYRPKIV